MTLEQFLRESEQLRDAALLAFAAAQNGDALEAARIQFLGDRSGQLKSMQQALGALPKEDKPAAGRAFNEVKTRLTAEHEERARALAGIRGSRQTLDPTMP